MSSVDVLFSGEKKDCEPKPVRSRQHFDVDRLPKYERPARFIKAVQIANVVTLGLFAPYAIGMTLTAEGVHFGAQAIACLLAVAIVAISCALINALLCGVLSVFDIAHDANAVRRMLAEQQRQRN